VTMSKTEILDELPKLTKIERQEIRLKLAELDGDDWVDHEDPLTVHEKALLEARLATYAKDPEAGSTWEEVEGRIRARLSQPNG
jgi:putative addiction module component (TIGR02574 family)